MINYLVYCSRPNRSMKVVIIINSSAESINKRNKSFSTFSTTISIRQLIRVMNMKMEYFSKRQIKCDFTCWNNEMIIKTFIVLSELLIFKKYLNLSNCKAQYIYYVNYII